MTTESAEDLLTEDEVAEILRIPKETLRHWRKNKTGPVAFKLGRRVFYHRQEVHRFVRSVAKTAASDYHDAFMQRNDLW